LRKTKRNVQFLTEPETNAILDALDDMSGSLTLRDRAIGKLAYYTALRSCDIAALNLSSIDWGRDIIAVRQQKTDAPLELPLSAAVGNAIHDYQVSERPSTDCPALFITTGKPHKRMHSSSMWAVSARIMGEAAIRQSANDRKGLHLFRHNLATSLLGNGAQQPVISGILGQGAPASLEAYLSTDTAHLRECALSIDRFPIGREVFADV
jgi:integrase